MSKQTTPDFVANVPALHLAGYACQIEEDEDGYRMNLLLRNDKGETVSKVEVDLDTESTGMRNDKVTYDQVELLGTAMCRFLNMGGHMSQLFNVTDIFVEALMQMPDCKLDSDWKLHDIMDIDDYVLHDSRTDTYYRVVENEFTEVVTDEELVYEDPIQVDSEVSF